MFYYSSIIMEKSVLKNPTMTIRQLPPHAYHPNPSLGVHRRAYIAYPEMKKWETALAD